MSAETPMDETEIHDLVLMFANSRIPRGSDAFQTLKYDFMRGDTPEPVLKDDTNDASAKENLDEVDGMVPPPPMKTALKDSSKKPKKSVRMTTPPKSLSHVHWSDGNDRNLASSLKPTHSARLFVKTTPKPILKHEDSLVVGGDIERKT
ncbi:uncharacterized protein LOC127861451 [Dreissena polymorpha]|uniref:Uncharacterized protein n=1 Tax=Dreissena polymorpha TaxID=45954 RepID=A0A9D3YDR3_DREPO|nr:uncharacterized protein LOC127861451 [Dreissena polymorpha]KAH3696644.1 hypothetical protein DPMN_084120 [Dreissena polymorpha]